jgi:L-fucose dehydrogenase
VDLGLNGKVIIVTGGGSGIGQAITRACLKEQARVVVIGRTTDATKQFAEEAKGAGYDCIFFETELGDPARCKAAVSFVQSQYGSVDGLVNNAGANDSVGLETGTPERFSESLNQNLLHYYAMAHYALPLLKTSKGSIVNISSKVALTGQGGTSAYAAAKGAQLALTREWAAELAPYEIRVNCVLPAEVLTPLYKSWLEGLHEPERTLASIERRIPFGHRMTTAEEIASMVVFLLSNKQSGHTTGQQIIVDGGYVHLDRALT